ncbi:MAG TPA: tripartite tricarboxylate transporter substrate binding protein [Bordetella sp.]|nr:tripartite tricarboxylate transporter substrate binding protein [Bordetella sp.]
MLSIRMLLSAAAACLAVLVMPGTAAQAAYPDRPIRLVIPWSVGGSTDMLGRVLADGMGRRLGTAIVVENKPGATGTIGYAQVARSEHDGYTLLLGTNSTFAIAPHFYHSLPYDTDKDFAAIGMIGANQQVLCVRPDEPYKTLSDLVAAAKAKPGAISYASSGVGGSSHLATELLMAMTDIDMLHVPYRGGAPAVQGILGGQTQVGFVDISVAEPLIRSGKLRALGTSGSQRAELLPDLPTLSETGAPGFESLTTFGLFVPAGTPAEIVKKLNGVMNAVLQDPQTRKQLAAQGFELNGGLPDAYRSYAMTESKKWGTLIEQRNIKLP